LNKSAPHDEADAVLEDSKKFTAISLRRHLNAKFLTTVGCTALAGAKARRAKGNTMSTLIKAGAAK